MSESSREDETTQKPLHLLVFPFPGSGHIIPLLDLTRRLLTHHHRHLTVTFLITPPLLSLLQPLLDSFPPSSLQPLVLSPPSRPHHSAGGLISNIRALHVLSDSIISWYRSHPSPPHALLADFFLGWTHSLCASLGLPRVVFYPSGAFACLLMNSMWRDAPHNPEGENNPEFQVRFDGVPGSPQFKWSELSWLFRSGKLGDPDWEVFREEIVSNLTSWGAVFNSFSEFESVYIEHFRKEMGHDRVWAAGPLLPSVEDLGLVAQRGGPSSIPAEEVLTWLDGKTGCSVVYVCFGSRTSLNAEESAVLGAALERSKVHFIWCVREANGAEGVMPDSKYQDRAAGRGFIIKGWAPQLAILRHPAVAAFLTHCGWNSVLESVSSGVMMLAWPTGADQYANARLVVGQLGLGMQIERHGPDGVPDPSELAQLFVDSVSPHRPERRRVMRLREAAATAVNGGNSTVDLDCFVKHLIDLKK